MQIDIRLVGGNDINEGRVEVRYHGNWGTICDDNFDEDDAKVVCNMLNLGNPTYWGSDDADGGWRFGSGHTKMILDDLHCKGNEPTVFDCAHEGVGSDDCQNDEVIGVVCERKS